ncbi:hypothetical protein [Lactiplantibacillus plantarum]|uniref:hypothetical protein n=1 Tax=Lactiplantibacillus plantarum TaxID=1590 RepID=UPI001BAC795C|nr:hypothetical protein [Lactiplantibacillus plantarum]MBS0954998.1 hypothetical protein [Lactiplantibacillus plantarum]
MQKYVINDDGTTNIEIRQNGISLSKHVDSKNFYEALTRSLRQSGCNFKSGQLPKDTISISESLESTSVTVFIPKRKRTMLTSDGVFLNVGNPAYIMRFTYSNEIINKTQICAVVADSTEDLNESTIIYRFPFGNMLGELDACTGSITVAANCPMDVVDAIKTFWKSTFNGETNPGALPLIKSLENKDFSDVLLVNSEIGSLKKLL